MTYSIFFFFQNTFNKKIKKFSTIEKTGSKKQRNRKKSDEIQKSTEIQISLQEKTRNL